MDDIYKTLTDILGKGHVSNQPEDRYFYARDPGLEMPHEPDYVVMPKTTEEVQSIVQLANREKIPIVPKGGGLALTGLTIPQKGGILMDMKRMDRILEVNEEARYVVIEGGVTEGALKAYLQYHHSNLQHSLPDAPPTVTVAANTMLHGQGRLTQQYGFNSDMVTGLEVVLPIGEVCKIGSCSVTPYWFSKGAPLPDLSGLFLGWLGATGIVTKMGVRLYPHKKLRDVEIFVTDRADLVPDIFFRLTHTEMTEDINVWFQPLPMMFKGNHHVTILITGDSDEELEFKRRMIWDSVQKYIDSKDGGFMLVLPEMKPTFLEEPQRSFVRFADLRKGGGFQYSGPIILVEKYPACVQEMEKAASKYKLLYAGFARVIGRNNCMMFSFAFAFNRDDSDEMDRVREASREVAHFVLEEGGIFWKPAIWEQKLMMKNMDPNTLQLFKNIKQSLDPNGIMNPGNWEVT